MISKGNTVSSSLEPGSLRSGSPVRHRANQSQVEKDGIAPNTRPRLSSDLMRSYDRKPPDLQEQQRAMDVDMAMHLSRARRERVASPGASSYEHNQVDQPQPRQNALSYQEDGDFFPSGREILDAEYDDDPLGIIEPNPEPMDLCLPHVCQGRDHVVVVSSEHMKIDDRRGHLSGLPTYASHISSNFDFSLIEQFAVEEKAILDVSSPIRPFASHLRHRNAGARSSEPPDSLTDEVIVQTPERRYSFHRELDQQSPDPQRRKAIDGKVALFEEIFDEPPASLPSCLTTGPEMPGAPVTVHSDNGVVATTETSKTPTKASRSPAVKVDTKNALQTGHDQPHRFSFYSNALSATIHARNLCELPAEGQSFEELFSGSSPAKVIPTTPAVSPTCSSPQNAVSSGDSSHAITGSNSMPETTRAPPVSQHRRMVGDDDFEGNTWWLDVQNPTDEEMKILSKAFSIHPLTTEDIQMEETREKIELFRSYYFVCYRSFDQDSYSPTYLEPLNMYIIVFREGTLSFHFRPMPHPQNVRRRIKQLKDFINVTSDWISYALVDDITDVFGPLIQSIEYEVDSIDELVLILKDTDESDMLRRIGTCRKKVMGLLRLMGNKADVVKGLAKRCNENWTVAPTSDIGLYLSDIQDHLITMTQNLNHYEKILSRSHSNYLAQISIEMTDANNRINDVLSKLTALGTVLIPMNLITGAFSLWLFFAIYQYNNQGFGG
ncbi:hypothetical protein HWV62_3917 [Athelia sp. TMB]|nr:hypothetical protein HWV62_3917 [Athelia sp. TMB]